VPPVPGSLKAAPAGTNLKLWLYDPRTSTPLATGIFLQNLTANTGFQFVGANSDGSLHLTLTAGSSYQFDTVEPNGASATFVRQRYQVTVSAAGAATIQDNAAGNLGYYAVTLKVAVVAATPQAQQLQDALKTLASEPASTFKQTSACQLMDQVTANRSFSTDLSAGFPKVRTRLPSTGHIRALIVPVDFPNLNGQDNPSVFFTPLANDMRDFYLKQSYGKLAFDFSIVPNWVRLPFSPSKYGFTSTNGSGDFGAYRSDIIAMTDGQIDYSQYDAVYFLVPKEMPMSQMGYGPAITAPTWTSTGYVTNGATGGADMYLVGNGPNSQLKWMAHETGHAFGLYDEDLNHASASLGSWGLMANNWSRNAIEHNGWDRYLQGWLPEAQVACLPKTGLTQSGTTVTLSPLVRQNTATKVMLVPLSGSKMLAIESRKNEGYDHIVASHEGVLVYTVDMTVAQLGGGYRTQRRVGSTDPAFEDAALHAGDVITVDGVTVTVTATGADGDTVKVSVP
jgi:M6 family metalloprotease-like protein